MTVRVQTEDFDVSAEIDRLTGGNPEIGAVATFIGKVRDNAKEGTINTLSLEHYPGMTEKEMVRIEQDAVKRFNLAASCIIHRVGTLQPGDNIVLVIAASKHRQAAFDACNYLMDYLKTSAPFWKKEAGASGASAWVDAREADENSLQRWGK